MLAPADVASYGSTIEPVTCLTGGEQIERSIDERHEWRRDRERKRKRAKHHQDRKRGTEITFAR